MAADLIAPRSATQPGPRAARVFDFLVIGAARSGTTSLWRGLDSHPQIRVPSDKEREFFSSDERYERGIRSYMEHTFEAVRDNQVLGTITPQLMQPDPRALETIVGRIQATCPDVKIMALLRDPVERGISQYRRMKKINKGREESFDAHIQRLIKKRGKLGKIPLVRAGDYGRILKPYFSEFDRDRIKIFFTADLDDEPAAVYQRIFEFLGVDPEHSSESPRIHVGGMEQRVKPEALEELMAELGRLGVFSSSNEDARRGFAWWLRHLWNCEPDEAGKEISDNLRRTLSKRYLADAETLLELGIEPPWLEDLRVAAA